MGRATVISGGTDGRYVIEMDYGLAQRNARVSKLDALLSELDDRKTWQQGQVDGFQGGLDSFAPEMDALIVEYVALSNAAPQDAAAIAAKRKQIDAKTAEIIKQQLWLGQAKNALAQTDLEIKQATLIRAALMALEITEQRPAWCADLTEDAAGEVATIEVPGESALILIAPQAPAPVAADGVLTAREIQSPAQVYWNAAVLPGWQKFKPTHRWGTITALDTAADTATVALAAAVSSAQGLDVNQATVLTGVPVQYMECNAAAFTVGDAVIVEFAGQDWAQPIVIGFLDNPRACGGPALYCIPADATAPYGWSPPVSDGSGPINGGKGSIALIGNPAGTTPAEINGTNRTAGVASPLARPGADALTDRVLRGVRADVIGIPASGATEMGNDDDPTVYSSLGRAAFEWISRTGRYVATAYDTCRLNGRDIGQPDDGTPYRVFVPDSALTGGTLTAFCLTEQFGTQFHLYRRPLAGGEAVAWTLVSTLDLTGIATTPTLEISLLKKIITNADASVVTLWFSTGMWGLGCVDIAIPTGTSDWLPAVSTFSKNYSQLVVDTVNPRIDTFTTQFSVAYDGAAKTFATLSGTRTVSQVFVEGANAVPDDDNSKPTTDTRTTTETVAIDFWGQVVQVADFTWEQNGSTDPVVGYSLEGVPYLADTTSAVQTFATLQSRQVYHFTGPGDPVLYSFKHYARTEIRQASGNNTSETGQVTIPAMQYGTGLVHGATDATMTDFARPAYQLTWVTTGGSTVETPPPEAGGSSSSFYATLYEGEFWRETMDQRTGSGYWTPPGYPGNGLGYETISDVMRAFKCLFYPATEATFANGGSHTTAVNTYANGVNLRAFNGFGIFSNPATTEGDEGFRTTITPGNSNNWPPLVFVYPTDSTLATDFTAWHTWCSDPAALSRYALTLALDPPVTGRLKHLQINSSP